MVLVVTIKDKNGKEKKLYAYKRGGIIMFKKEKMRDALEELPEGYEIKYMPNSLPYAKKL